MHVEPVSKAIKSGKCKGGYPIRIVMNKYLSTMAADVGDRHVGYQHSAGVL